MDYSSEVCCDKDTLIKKEENQIELPLDVRKDLEARNTLEVMLENIGLSWEHYKLLFLLTLYLSGEGFVMIGISLLVPVISEPWKLSEFQKGFLGGSIFLGFTFGAIFSGLISDKQGRKVSILVGNVISLIGGIAGYIYSLKIEFIMMSNIFVGFGIGLCIPAMMSLCTEITPSKIRSVIIGGIWLVFVAGEIICCLIAMKLKIYLFENGTWRLLLLYRCLCVSYLGIIHFLFLIYNLFLFIIF
jgi:MFS family permease